MEDSSWKTKAKSFISQCIRVMKVTKKPDKNEFRMLIKISGLGIAAIGMIGFLLFMINSLIFKS